MMRRMVFTGKPPLTEEVTSAMANPPGIIARRQALTRILAGIAEIVDVFDEGLGVLGG